MSRIRFRSISGSLLVTGSVSGNTLTFEKGDGTSFDLRVDTGSGAIVTDITDLNNYTGSANTRFDNLEAVTGSYLVSDDTGSLVYSGSFDGVSTLTLYLPDGNLDLDLSALTDTTVDISALNTFTGSAESRLDSIEGATGSYITAVIAGDGLSGGASTGDATLTLDSGSTHFISAVLGSGLFRLTGSVYATTNDVAITGSLDINFVESDQEFRVYSQSSIQFSINNEGVAVLAPRDGEPTAVSGGMYFSTDGNFYFGIQQ